MVICSPDHGYKRRSRYAADRSVLHDLFVLPQLRREQGLNFCKIAAPFDSKGLIGFKGDVD